MLLRGKPSARVRAALLATALFAPLTPVGAFGAEGDPAPVLYVDGMTTVAENNDGTRDRPFRNIRDAVAALGGPGVVNILPAVYPENVTVLEGVTLQGVARDTGTAVHGKDWPGLVRGSVNVGSPADPGDDVVLDGLAIAIPEPEPDNWEAVSVNAGHGIVVSDNLMTGPENGPIGTRGIQTQQAPAGAVDITIQGNRIVGTQFGVVVNAGATASVLGNELIATRETALILDTGHAVTIENNSIRNNLGPGIGIHAFHADTVLRRNSFSGNATAVWAPTGVAVDASQNWWGHAAGPITESSPPSLQQPDVQPGEEPDPDAARDDVEGNQQEGEEYASRQEVSGDVQFDPWCSADGCPQAPISVHGLVSGIGGPVAGAEVQASWINPVESASAQTNDGGAFRLAFDRPWGQVAGTAVAITARKDDWSDGQTLTLGDEPRYSQDFALAEDGAQGDAAESEISAEPKSATVDGVTERTVSVPSDGTTPATISVTVRTSAGQLRTSPGDDVEISTTFGELSEVQWVGHGVWQAELTSAQPGEAEVFAFVNDEPVSGKADVKFVIGPPSAEHSTITSSDASLTADGASASVLTVTVRDGGGNLRPTTTERHDIIRLSVNTTPDGTPNGTLGPVKDNGDGTYTAEYRASTTTGTAVISAHVRESMVHEEVTLGDTSIALTPGPASAARSTMRSDDTDIPADGVTPLTVTVQVKDAHGNDRTRAEDDPADTVVFTTDFVDTEEEPPAHRQTEHPAVAADENGVATIQIPSAEKGRVTVTATVEDQPVSGSVVATFGDVPPAPDPSKSTIVSDVTTRAANGTHAAKITLQVKGTDNQSYAGSVQVSLTASGAGKLSSSANTPGTQSTLSGTTNSTGKFEAFVTSTVAEQVSVTGALGDAPITDATGQPVVASVTFVAVSSPAHSTVWTTSPESTADNSSTVTITFQAKDADGVNRTVVGEQVVLSTDLGTLASSSGTTDANGRFTTTLKSADAGTARVTATLNGQPVTSSASVVFHAPAVPSKSGLSANRTVVGADDIRTATITVQLNTASDQPRQLGTDNVQLTTEPGVNVRNKRYEAPGKWLFDVSAQVTRASSPVSATVNSVPIGKSVHLTFEAPTSAMRSTLTRNPSTGNRRSNGTDQVIVEVQANNAAGSPRTGDGDDVQLTVTGLPLATLTPVTYVGGATGTYRATLTSTGSGEATITGHINQQSIQGSATAPTELKVKFVAVASAAHSTVELVTPSEGGNRLANGADGTAVRAQLRDASGAVLGASGDRVELTTDLGYFDVAGQPTVLQDWVGSDGKLTTTIKSASAGAATIRAVLLTDQDGDGVRETRTPFGTTAAVTFEPLAAPETTTLTASPEELVGNDVVQSTITIQAKDLGGANRTTGREMFSLTRQPVAGTTLGGVTDVGNGTYTATLKSSVSGPVKVTATVRGVQVSDDVTVNFVGKGAGAHSTTSVLNDFVAANNSNVANVMVQVRRADSSMQTVPGDTITLTPPPNVTASAPVYQGGGQYLFTVKSSVPAQATVGIKINGEDMPPTAWPVITFEPATAPDKTAITATPATIRGDGAESSVIEVQTKNAAGSNRRGVDDALVLSVGSGHAFSNGQQTVTATPAGAGKYTATLTSTTSGTATITGTVGGVAITGGNATVTVHGPTSAVHSALSTTDADGKVTANGTATMTIVLTPKTAAGQARQTSGDTVAFTTDRGSFAGAAAGTPKQINATWDATSKTYRATLVAGTAAGSARITGTINGTTPDEAIGVPAGGLLVEFVPGAASIEKSQVSAPGDPGTTTITADGVSETTITVTLKDVNDNPLTTSHTEPVAVTSSRGSVLAVTDNQDGTYSARLRAASSEAVATVRANIGTGDDTVLDWIKDTASVTMEAKTVASASQVTATPASAPADGETEVAITVQARSAANVNRTIGGDNVELTASRGTLSAVTDNEDGTYSAMLTAPVQSGPVTIGGKINGGSLPTTSVTFFAMTKAAGSDISASPASVPADGTSTSTITVTAKDHAGAARTVGGETVELETSAGTMSTVADNGDGTYTATLTAPTQAGTAAIDGSIGGNPITDTATVAFVAATDAGESTIEASPTTLHANGTDTATVTVTAKDYAGDARGIGGETVTLATTLGSLGPVLDNADGTYIAVFTAGETAGTATITGTIGGDTVGDHAQIGLEEVTAPSAPASASAEDGDGEATISWTAPSDNGGSPVTGYRVSAEPAADVTGSTTRTAGAEDRSLDFTGLTGGVTYSFTVVAVNAKNHDSDGATVQNVKPWGAPGAPTDADAQRGNREATVTWTPGSDGGRPLTHYVISATNLATSFVHTATVDAPATSGTVTGLVNGGTYDVHVQAVNQKEKTSVASETARVIPAAVPDKPTGLNAVAGNAKVALSWTAPAEDGGESVDSYIVTVTPAGGAATTHETATTTLDVTGLVNGTVYTFTVAAVNDVGAGPDSDSVSATPKALSSGPGPGPIPPQPSPSATSSPTPSPTPSPTSAPGPLPGPGPVRINGEDRASTAAAVSAAHFDPGVSVVYVATAANFADALAGGPAAAHGGGPVLLVERDRVPESTSFELQRLEPDRVVVLGGTGAISDLVAEQLDETAPVERVSGSDRFATAAAVSAATFPEHTPVVYIATGNGFADALSGGAAAARDRGPVLLAGDGELPEATAAELRRLAPRQIVVLGGSGAVSPEVAAALEEYTEGAVERLSGPDRYATSAAIAARMFPVAVDTVFIATGENFPDALAGVPAAAREKAPLLLVRLDGVPETVAAQLERLRPRRIAILGGSGAVSAETEDALSAYTFH